MTKFSCKQLELNRKTVVDLIALENPHYPLKDAAIARHLGCSALWVSQVRRANNIPNCRDRKKPHEPTN
jgi:AraC-like DNA-binding protein